MKPFLCPTLLAFLTSSIATAQPPALDDQLAKLDIGTIALGTLSRPPLANMMSRDVSARLRQAVKADTAAWEQVKSLDDWNAFRDKRLKALRDSLGVFPDPPTDLNVRVTGTIEGDGYRIDKLVYRTRPGLYVTANLYRPEKPGASMPGILISHLHQYPKFNIYCQAMGTTWARAGCVVLVPDHVGHGERQQHPFGSEADFVQPFPKTRHDYHHRYDLGIQLNLIGDSLMGWLVYDMMRGVDLLLAQKGVDAKRIIILGEPAGGGDIAAVTAAIDPRIAGAVVTNFGGPQPETPYPLPRDAEDSFEFAGSGSWESTRNLRLSARDGFLHWTIAAMIAPRKFLYTHEFFWDREQDPVWRRLQQVYRWHKADRSLAGVSGRGFVLGSPPRNTHWLASNREAMYPILERWFGIPNPGKEYSQLLPARDLLCLTPDIKKEMVPVHELAGKIADEHLTASRKSYQGLTPEKQRERMRGEWAKVLGDVTPREPRVIDRHQPIALNGATVHRVHLSVEPGIVMPLTLMTPDGVKMPPVVMCLSQDGQQATLHHRATTFAKLLQDGVAVCLLDYRGAGETSPGVNRGKSGPSTAIASTEQMLGQTLLAGRIRDVRSALQYLRSRPEIDGRAIALWGLSLNQTNPPGEWIVPYDAAERPQLAEPIPGLLALFTVLYDDDVRAVLIQNGLVDFRSILNARQSHVPYDAIVPGALAFGDLPDVAAVLARPVRFEASVNSWNQHLPADQVASRYPPNAKHLEFTNAQNLRSTTEWLVAQLAAARGR